MSESWKAVPGYPMYDVSNQGQVRSWHKGGRYQGRRKEPKTLSPTLSVGYPSVTLCQKGCGKQWRVHQLVLTTFVGPCPSGMECCHSDGTRTNNHLENLRWDSRSANKLDEVRRGTHRYGTTHGEENSASKLTEADVIEIRCLYNRGEITQHDLGTHFGVDQATIGKTVNRKIWAHLE